MLTPCWLKQVVTAATWPGVSWLWTISVLWSPPKFVVMPSIWQMLIRRRRWTRDDLELTARRTGQPQHRRVGVRTAQVCGADLKVQPGLLGNRKAVRDAVIVRLHAQQPGDKRPSVPWPRPVAAKLP